jgi:KUP system potassium uptake protein
MINGMFSIVYQGITTYIMPVFKVEYTSAQLRSQIYVGFVNWVLLVAVLFVMVEFRESGRLAAAYGLAVTGTMTLTGIIMTWIFYLRGKIFYAAISVFVAFVDIVFLLSNLYKIPHGGYWSIVLASIPFAIIILYTAGQKRLFGAVSHMDRDTFLEKYQEAYKSMNKIKGTVYGYLLDPLRIHHGVLLTHIEPDH